MPTKEEFSSFLRNHIGRLTPTDAEEIAELLKAQGWLTLDGDASNAQLEGDDTPSPAPDAVTEPNQPNEEEEYDDSDEDEDDEDEEVKAAAKPKHKRPRAATTSRKHYRK